MSPPPTDPLGRIGGMLLRPRAVLEDTVVRPGRTGGVVVAVAAAVGLMVQPEATARAILLVPVAPGAGLGGLVRVLGATVLWEIFAVVAFASALEWVAHRRRVAAEPEGLFAAGMLCLVPMLVLCLVGALLRFSGAVEASGAAEALAARLPPVGWGALVTGRLDPGLAAFRLALAHLPTGFLLGLVARAVLRNQSAASGERG